MKNERGGKLEAYRKLKRKVSMLRSPAVFQVLCFTAWDSERKSEPVLFFTLHHIFVTSFQNPPVFEVTVKFTLLWNHYIANSDNSYETGEILVLREFEESEILTT